MLYGSLQPKGSRDAWGGGKGKKKAAKDKAQILEQIVSSKKQEEEEEKRGLDKSIPAQVAFEKMQEKRQVEWVLKKALKTHKQRAVEINRHLDALSIQLLPEEADIPYHIPKISWIK